MFSSFNSIHLKVYDEVIFGTLRPSLFHLTRRKLLERIIFDANTIKVATIPIGEDISPYFENDYTYLGYRSKMDYEIRLVDGMPGKRDVFLAPVSKYQLRELIDLPRFSSLKCACFLELLGDEFERIKIRSEWALSNSTYEKALRSYANRHLQKSKKQYHDSRICLKETLEKRDQDDVYIVFVLNLFIIRTILFFQKFFRPYLSICRDESEEHLVSELIREVSLCKLGALFSCNGKRNCIYKDQGLQGIPEYCGIPQSQDEDQTDANVRALGQLRFNGQVNVLVDIFIQLFEELKINGKPIIETDYRQLEEFLVRNFVDKTGKPLSRHTIITLLKPYRTDKRLSPQSPRRVNVRNIIKKNGPVD